MASKWSIAGVTGMIRYGYLSAATVQSWRAKKDGDTWTLTATLAEHDAFRVTQQPLNFVVPVQGGVWIWPILSLTVKGAALTATLGPFSKG